MFSNILFTSVLIVDIIVSIFFLTPLTTILLIIGVNNFKISALIPPWKFKLISLVVRSN